MTRLLRDFSFGIAFGLGAALARFFAVPLLLFAGAFAVWAGLWANVHHLPFIQGIRHAAISIRHLLVVLGVNRRV